MVNKNMNKNRIKNTSKNPTPEWLMGGNPNAILSQERQGQTEVVKSCQLPLKRRVSDKEYSAITEYAKMGIIVTGWGKVDELFGTFILPQGWKKVATDHSMYTHLLDEKGRIRASIFYKAAFYDRKADISFERRFSIRIVTTLPQEELGHFENQNVQVRNPQYREDQDEIRFDRRRGTIIERYDLTPKYIKEVQQVWVPKFKNFYEERIAAPQYFEIYDGQQLIHSTKDKSVIFTTAYHEENHSEWWNAYDAVENGLRKEAETYLEQKYPDWKNIHAYWD